MHGDLVNTLFALVCAVDLVVIVWGLVMYFAEMGNEMGKKHSKGIFLGGIVWLIILMCLFALVGWVRGAIGI